MAVNGRRVTAKDVPERLREGFLRFPQVKFTLDKVEGHESASTIDGTVDVCWQHYRERYAYTYRSLSTPRAVQTTVLQAKDGASRLGLRPLVIVPYLSEERLAGLEEQNVSGMDLCGNCILLADHFLLGNSGHPNLFPESQPIKNIFRNNSSIFARCFLLRREFPSLTGLREYANLRMIVGERQAPSQKGLLAIGTASKVVGSLQEELMVTKHGNALKLVDAKSLMQALLRNYRPPAGLRIKGRTALAPDIVWKRLFETPSEHLQSITTGVGSASWYGLLSQPDMLSLYVSNIEMARELLEVEETRIFPNIELIEEGAPVVYFDGRPEAFQVWASPVQTWLELMSSGPREQEGAKGLEAALMDGRAATLP